ncbi:MAG: Lrp/AsnC family transcriptional regulator [Verrucomicrobia bacterium]|nr:Lrp/AsnC family transcriptional regulator [Verrucomicrobiota bacterium]
MTDPILKQLEKNSKLSASELAVLLGRDEKEIAEQISQFEKDGVILGYHVVVDPPEKTGNVGVTALIEVKLTPERGGGFDLLAARISKFDSVTSCYLMSGGYDLAVVVNGENLHDVARFVSEKLSTIEGVISTATHFQLKTYKQSGFLAHTESETKRLAVAP